MTASNGVGSPAQASSQLTNAVVNASAPPKNTAPPAISGTAAQGQTLTASPGTWSGYPAPTYTYQWERCNQSGASCTAISGATATTYVLTRADVGTRTVVAVTASNGVGTPQSANSSATAIVTGAPVNTAVPKLSGTRRPGQHADRHAGQLDAATRRRACVTSGCAATARARSAAPSRAPPASPTRSARPTSGTRVRIYVYGSNTVATTLARSAATAVVAASATGSGTLSLRRERPTLRLSVKASRGRPSVHARERRPPGRPPADARARSPTTGSR